MNGLEDIIVVILSTFALLAIAWFLLHDSDYWP